MDKGCGYHQAYHIPLLPSYLATLQLANGTDIYTVSKMLGHTNVRTTQIYTKVVDEKKENAADAIQINLVNIE